eukprot:332156-Pleurochrysis_carterae.AAC.1
MRSTEIAIPVTGLPNRTLGMQKAPKRGARGMRERMCGRAKTAEPKPSEVRRRRASEDAQSTKG